MDNNSFRTVIMVNASPAEAIQKINQVSGWWAKKVKGPSQNLNDAFTVDFGSTWVDFQITELIPNKKVIWKVTGCNLQWIGNKKEWNGTEVIFEVTDVNGTTRIDFTHAGLVPSFECYEDCREGWTGHVTESLLKFINEGKGMPE